MQLMLRKVNFRRRAVFFSSSVILGELDRVLSNLLGLFCPFLESQRDDCLNFQKS